MTFDTYNIRSIIGTMLISLISVVCIQAQVDKDSELYKTLKVKDSLLFDYTFNSCDMEGLNELIAEDFEFYHDKGGFNPSKTDFMEGIKNGLCNPSNKTKSRRQLDVHTLEVYPMQANGKTYGALQTGEHRFFETLNGKENPGSIAKFSHLWVLENEQWKLKRVLSYDHKMQQDDSVIQLTDNQLQRFIGTYQSEKMGNIIVKKGTGNLVLTSGNKDFSLLPLSTTVFKNDKRPLKFQFVEEEGINKLIVTENDQVVEVALKIK